MQERIDEGLYNRRLKALAGQGAHEVIVAVPVGSAQRLAEVARLCDEVVCLLAPEDLRAIGLYYQDFSQVEDDEVIALLRGEATAGPSVPVGAEQRAEEE